MLRESNEDTLFPEAKGEASVSSIFTAAQDVGMTLTESFFQKKAREQASKFGKKLTPQEANDRFPGLGADRDITEGEAQYLYDYKKEKAEAQKVINSASDSFLKGTVLPFVAGAAESLTDPAEVTIGLITGGMGNALKGASLASKVGVDFVEAGISQAIAEAPIAMEMKENFEEYTAKQFAQNALMASVLQVGLTHGGSAAFKGTAKALGYVGEKTSENLGRLQRHLEANGVNSSGIMNKAINEIKDKFEGIDNLKTTIRNNFDDIDVDGVDNFEDAINLVKERYKAGEIDDVAMDAFAKEAFENGVDPQMMARSVEDTTYTFSDQLVEDVKNMADDPKYKNGFDDRYDAELDEIEKTPAEAIDDEILASYNAVKEQLPEEMLEETVELGDGKKVKVKDMLDKAENMKEEQIFFKDYAACLWGA